MTPEPRDPAPVRVPAHISVPSNAPNGCKAFMGPFSIVITATPSGRTANVAPRAGICGACDRGFVRRSVLLREKDKTRRVRYRHAIDCIRIVIPDYIKGGSLNHRGQEWGGDTRLRPVSDACFPWTLASQAPLMARYVAQCLPGW